MPYWEKAARLVEADILATEQVIAELHGLADHAGASPRRDGLDPLRVMLKQKEESLAFYRHLLEEIREEQPPSGAAI